MKKVTKATLAILIGIALLSVMVTPAMAADAWQSDIDVISGLRDIGEASAPTVFYKDATWYLIAGELDGVFNGYEWTGSVWKSDRAIVSGLGDVGYRSAPTVFNKDGTWYLIAGEDRAVFNGYKWTGSEWQSDPAIVSGLVTDCSENMPTVFNMDGTWYLISGRPLSGKFYVGYRWADGAWESDSAIVSGLGTGNAPTVFNKDGTWYLISGEWYGRFYGYKWTDSTWESYSAIVSGLEDVGLRSAPTVFNKDGTWYLISGERYGTFFGWYMVKTADLTPTAINVPELFVNKTSTINATIANVGEVNASSFNVSLSANGAVVDTVNVPSLSAGNSTNVSFEWPPALGGDQELCVVADSDNEIDEIINEDNNKKCILVTVNAPDLTPTAINVPATLILNHSCTIIATIGNIGTLDASAFNVCLSANSEFADTVTVPSLSAGNSTTVSFEWTPASVGDQELCVAADTDDSIVEMDEANNKKCIPVAVTVNASDLTPTAINVPELFVNLTSTVTATIDNVGILDASAFNVSLSASGSVIDTVNVASLSAGGSTTVSFEWTPALGSDHTLCVIADHDNAITELDEANNEICIVVTVSASDLTTTAINAPATLIVNQPSTITATIANVGTFDASAFNVSLSVNGSVVGTASVPSLNAGTSTTVSFGWTPELGGDQELCVAADSDDVLTELDEANNEKCIVVTVNAPDLMPTAITAPALLFVDQPGTVTATIANVGILDAPAFNVSLVASGSVIGTAKVPSLNAGSSTNLSFEWTPTAAGEPELCVVADAANEIVEMDETNNDKCIFVTVEDIVWHYSGLSMPWDAERLQNNHTLITEFGKHRVIEVTPITLTKEIIYGNGTAGSGENQLNCPVDAERLSDGNTTLITDSKNHRVIDVDSDKNIVWQYGNGTPGDGINQLNYPMDAERLPNGNTLITEEHNCRVIELRTSDYDTAKPDNNFTADSIMWQYGTTGVSGSGANELNFPKDADRLDNGNTIIADYRNHRVIEVNATGEIVWQYGTAGTAGSGANQLWYPTDAERLSNNHTLISDHSNHRVIEVNEAKERVWQYGTSDVAGSGANELYNPADAEQLSNGNMLICDKDNNRIIEVVPGVIDVIAIAIETAPQKLYAWLTLCDVTATIFNNGSAHSGRFHASLYADGIEVDTGTVGDIPAGGSANVTLEWLPTKVGDYNLTVIADSDDVIVETNEGNNELTKEVSVLPTTVKRLTFDSNSSVNPNVAADSKSNLHLVWHDDLGEGSGLYYKKLAPDGTILVNDKMVSPGSGPKIAVDSRDEVHVAFNNGTNSINVSYMKLDNLGNTLIEPKQVISGVYNQPCNPGWLPAKPCGIAVDGSGKVHVLACCNCGRLDKGYRQDLKYVKLDNEGNELVNYTIEHLTTPTMYGTWDSMGMPPSGIAVDSAGSAYTAYSKGLGGRSERYLDCLWPSCLKVYYVKIDGEGVHKQELTGDLPLPSLYPSVCVDSADNKYVVWSQHNRTATIVPISDRTGYRILYGFDFYLTKFDKSGNNVIDRKRLTYEDYPVESFWDDSTYYHIYGIRRPIIDTESGVIHAAWSVHDVDGAYSPPGYVPEPEAGEDNNIWYMGFDTSGKTLINKTLISIAGGNSWEPCIDAVEDGSHLVWTDNRDGNPEIYYAKTEAPPDRVFILRPADQWTTQNVVAAYTVGILSTMNITETFNLTLDNIDNASIAELSSSTITLEPYSVGEVTLNVTDAVVGDYRVTVTAASQTNSGIQDSATITTSVVVPTPDLIVTAIDAYHNDTGYPPYFNLSNEVDVTVKNAGTADAGTFNVGLYANDTRIDTQSVSGLGIGMSETVQLKWTPTGIDCDDGGTPITYTLKAIADCDNAINELDETNNELTAAETAYWAGYSADEEFEEFSHGTIRGGLIYTTGDGSYDGLYSHGDFKDTTYKITLPDSASVRHARLNVYYTWSKHDYPVMEVSINGIVVPSSARYNDRPCDSPAIGFEYPWGNYVYNLTSYITDSRSYTVTVRNSGNETNQSNFCIAAPGLVILYEDSSMPEYEYWILEGADVVEGGRRGGAGYLSLEECTNDAVFPRSIDLSNVSGATLGMVSIWGGAAWGEYTSYYWFNDNYLGNATILGGYGSLYNKTIGGISMFVGASGNAQVGANVSDVTEWLMADNNTVTFGDNGDSMMPSNAFLLVEYPVDYGVSVTIDEVCQKLLPGENTSYTVRVKNTGIFEASYEVTMSGTAVNESTIDVSKLNWNTTCNLTSGSEHVTTVNISTTEDTQGGTYTLIATAVCDQKPNVTDSDTTKLDVAALPIPPDFLVGNQAGKVELFMNSGGSFVSQGEIADIGDLAWGLASGDFNGDGYTDFIVGDYAGQVELFLGHGFSSAEMITGIGGEAYGLTSGDYDNNGSVDFIVGNGAGELKLFLNDGTGAFKSDGVIDDLGDHAWALTSCDFDGDGDIDFISGDYDGTLKRFTNDGNGNFASSTIADIGNETYGVTSGDYDNDCDCDFLATANDGEVKLFKNNGEGSFTECETVISLGAWRYGLESNDFDVDGDIDVLGETSDDTVNLYKNDGSGNFVFDTVVASPGLKPRGLTSGNFVMPVMPDLTATRIDIPILLCANVSNVITATIENVGNGNAGALFNTTLCVDGSEVETRNVSALNADASMKVSFSWTPTHTGSYELRVMADSAGAIAEFNESNNDMTKAVTAAECVLPPVPYIIKSGGVFYENETPCIDPIVNVTNLGTGSEWPANTSDYYYYLVLDSRNISEGNVLEFDATDPAATQENVTDHTVTSDEINDGGLFGFNLTLTLTTNQPPVADANGPYTGTVEVEITFNGSGSYDPDPDGTIVSYEWDFGDGTNGTGVKPKHTYATAKPYTVTLTVTDNERATGTDTALVNVSSEKDIEANVSYDPKKVKLNSSGNLKAFITLPEGYNATVADINVSTVTCEEALVIGSKITGKGVLEAKFEIQKLNVSVGEAVLLTVKGKLYDGRPFEGSDTVEVVYS